MKLSRGTIAMSNLAILAVIATAPFSGCGIVGGDGRSLKHVSYRGWSDAIVMSNGRVEVVIVPSIGRVMQFRRVGEQEGPFWENSQMFGRAPNPTSNEWGNFGADKTWPSPQADWPKIATRGWPPPPAFDSMPVEWKPSSVNDGLLISPVDPYYGIRTIRHIKLPANLPLMKITTTYEKVQGEPKKVGVWIVTQLKDAVGVFAPIPKASRFAEGFNRQSDQLPANLKFENGLVSLTRNRAGSYKIGTDASTLLWVGEKEMVRIDSPRSTGAEYPDHSSSAEVYTNPDPLAYVELEMLGPLHTMRVGDKISQVNQYMLMRRLLPSAEAEARKIFGK
ncbi:MAG: hypothetical protein HY043_15695 [Verrucomicrobia bacterium]|nr:hypothetical protein [Verrucomicrobiota bacterium]